MTALTKEQIYEAVTDLAEESGMSADEYIASLIGQRESELLKRTEGLDEDIAFEIGESRRLKRENRSRERENARRAEMEEDISRFRTYFPDVVAKDIPEEVWAEVAQGVSLTHAYALYLAAAGYEDAKAQEINRVNSGRSAPVGGEAAEEALTKEQVENMSPQAVKKNYNRILSSIKSWRL